MEFQRRHSQATLLEQGQTAVAASSSQVVTASSKLEASSSKIEASSSKLESSSSSSTRRASSSQRQASSQVETTGVVEARRLSGNLVGTLSCCRLYCTGLCR